MKHTFTKGRVAAFAALLALGAFVVMSGGSAVAAPGEHDHGVPSEHWGVNARNTIGSPVGDLRNGPYGSFGVTGSLARPPFGTGSLGIETADGTEKVDFGNEVDFYGDNVLALNQVGFHVFQTGENASPNPKNMPNIRMEINPNKLACPGVTYTTMVWVPDASPTINKWSGYIDATSTGYWYFTGTAGTCTGCNQATQCSFTAAKASLNDGSPVPIVYTFNVGKGRDQMWIGAVDGLRYNSSIFDFELFGVFERHCGGGTPRNC